MAAGGETLEQMFVQFAKFGDSKSDGKAITLTNCDKWMKQAKVVDGKKITTTDTAICFNKMKSKTVTFQQFLQYIEDLAKYKNANADDLKQKLLQCGLPGLSHATHVVKVGGVDRLTDTSQYTGTHKERFDATGKGKGIAGREEVADDSGYVAAYKDADTYDKTHK